MACRQHFLDYHRLLGIVLVVFAHIELTVGPLGATDENGNVADWVVDDHARGTSPRASLATRWVSVCRPWCIPSLFWISGAALAFGNTRDAVGKSIPKLLIVTVIGVLLNAAIWQLGPADPDCSPFTPCVGKGILFDFSICAFSGVIFPMVFQMWYPLALIVYLLWNWPLLMCFGDEQSKSGRLDALVAGKQKWWLLAQGIISCVSYAGMSLMTPSPIQTAIWLCSWEVVFEALLLMSFKKYRPSGLSLRAIQYALGFVAVMKFGATPFAHEIKGLGVAFGLYTAIGFNQFFVLGLCMMKCRVCESFGNAAALASRAWPFMLLLLTALAPTTNWIRAGNLTYPFYPHALDRCLYIGYAVLAMFVVDRLSRVEGLACGPLSKHLNIAGLVLYLIHPTLMQILLQYSPRLRTEVEQLWLVVVAIVIVPALLMDLLRKSKSTPNLEVPLLSEKGYKEKTLHEDEVSARVSTAMGE